MLFKCKVKISCFKKTYMEMSPMGALSLGRLEQRVPILRSVYFLLFGTFLVTSSWVIFVPEMGEWTAVEKGETRGWEGR